VGQGTAGLGAAEKKEGTQHPERGGRVEVHWRGDRRGRSGVLPESPVREYLPIPLKNSPPLGWAQGSNQGQGSEDLQGRAFLKVEVGRTVGREVGMHVRMPTCKPTQRSR
jgi:hypothetical protein